jgi:hypothetical protein
MARYSAVVKSSAALAADTAFAALVPGASVAARLRRVTIGTVSGATVPASQQVVVGINRGTARGTATTTATGIRLDPRSGPSSITSVDTAWSTAPTLGSADMFRVPFNTQAGADLPWEGIEELWSDIGTANPLLFINRDNALPAGHSYVLTVEWEE